MCELFGDQLPQEPAVAATPPEALRHLKVLCADSKYREMPSRAWGHGLPLDKVVKLMEGLNPGLCQSWDVAGPEARLRYLLNNIPLNQRNINV